MASSTFKSKPMPSLVPRGQYEGQPAIGLSRPVWVIGSRKGCHLQLVSSTISQVHAVIINTGQGLYIRDLASRTHTFVNRQAVTEAVLKEGDKLQIGKFKFWFTDPTAQPGATMPTAEPAILQITGDSMHLPLDSRVTTIGRREGCDIALDDAAVSSTHAMVLDIAGRHFIRDLGSRTGTFLNGNKVHQEELHSGDVIRIGESEITYSLENATSAAEEAAPETADESELAADLSIASTVEEDRPIPLSMSDEEAKPEVSATATPMPADEEPAETLAPPAVPQSSAAPDISPLPLDIDELEEPAEEAVADSESSKEASDAAIDDALGLSPVSEAVGADESTSDATADASAEANDDVLDLSSLNEPAAEAEEEQPSVAPDAVDEVLDLSGLDQPAPSPAAAAEHEDLLDLSADYEKPIEVDNADNEDTAFHVTLTDEPAKAEPEPEPTPAKRRGWRSSSDQETPASADQGATSAISADDLAARGGAEPVDEAELSPLSLQPSDDEAAADERSIPELTATDEADALALDALNAPAEEMPTQAELTADALAIDAVNAKLEEAPASPAATEEAADEADALALDALNAPADEAPAALDLADEHAAAPQDEVTSGDLELSTESSPLDLSDAHAENAETSAKAPAEDVFAGVDIEALALEALEESEPLSLDSVATEASADDAVANAETSPTISATHDVDLPGEIEVSSNDLSLSTDSADPSAIADASPVLEAGVAEEIPLDELPSAEPALDLSSSASPTDAEAVAPIGSSAVESLDLNTPDTLPPLPTEENVKPNWQDKSAEAVALLPDSPFEAPVDQLHLDEYEVIDPPATSHDSIMDATIVPRSEVSATSDVPMLELDAPAAEQPAAPVNEGKAGKKLKPSRGRPKKGQAQPVVEQTPLPPPLEKSVGVKPSARRRGPAAKRGKKGALPEIETVETNETVSPSIDEPSQSATSAGAAEVLAATDQSDASAANDSIGTADVAENREVIESTEPTPESALDLDRSVTEDRAAEPAADASVEKSIEKLSDSVFGRAVEELSGSVLGDLVEPARGKSPLEQIVSEASTFVAHDGQSADIGDKFSDELVAGDLSDLQPPENLNDEPVAESSVDADVLNTKSDESEFANLEELAAPADSAEEAADQVAWLQPQAPGPIGEAAETQFTSPPDEAVTTWAGSPSAADLSASATDTVEPLPTLDLESLAEPIGEVSGTTDAAPVEEDEAAVQAEFESLVETGETDDTAAPVEGADASTDTIAPAGDAEFPPPATDVAPPRTGPHQPSPGPGFFGMARDTDTFIGGMPLILPDLQPPPPTFGRVSVKFGETVARDSHISPPPPPLMIGDDEPEGPVAEAPMPNETASPKSESPTSEAPTIPPEALRPTPPRPRRPRLADYEKRFADVGEDAALQEMLRSKPPGAPSKETATPSGFEGLSIASPVREADVFSQMPAAVTSFAGDSSKAIDPFLVDKQASIDLAARNIAPGHVPPGSEPNIPAGMESPESDAFGTEIPMAGRSIDPFGMTNKMRRSSQPASVDPNFTYTGPNYRRRKIGLPVMLGAMVVCMIVAGLAGYMLAPVSSTISAKATFANLSQRTAFDQLKFHREEEGIVNSEIVRAQAVSILKQQDPKLDPGLLADAFMFEKMTRDLQWPEKSNSLLFQFQTSDQNGDRRRLSALLTAIYNENKHLLDTAAQNRKALDQAQAHLDELNGQLSALVAKIRVLNNAEDRPSGSQVADVERQAKIASDTWGQAVDNVKELQATLDRLTPEDSGRGVPEGIESGTDPEKDPVVLQIREELAALNAKIAAMKPQNGNATEQARKTLTDALQKFQDQLTETQSKMGNSPELTAYVLPAQKLQAMSKQLASDLIDQQRDQNQRLADMKRRLEEKAQARRDELFNTDPALKDLNEQLSQARRWNNAAASNGMDAEAARWQTEIDNTAVKIQARQTELGQDPVYTKLNSDIQALIDDSGKALATDQQLLQAQLDDVAMKLNAALPGFEKLPADQKALGEALAMRSKDLFNARLAYMAAVGSIKPQESDDLRRLQASAQQLSMKIEQRTAELVNADKNKKNQSDLDKANAARKIEDVKSSLAIAQKAEVDAQNKWLAKQAELNALRDKVNLAHKDDAKLTEYQLQRPALEAQISAAMKDLDSKRLLGTASITPDLPTPDSVMIGETHDSRLMYSVVCTLFVVGLFTFLILLGGFHHAPTPMAHRATVESVDPITKDTEEEPDDAVTV